LTILLPQKPAEPPAAPAREVRQPYLLTTSVYGSDAAVEWPSHVHTEHELIWTDRGIVTMFVEGKQWTLTPGVGLWLPAGTRHEGATGERSAVRATYFDPDSWPRQWDNPVTVNVNPAVRELLLHLKYAAMTMEQRIRAQRVCIDMLHVSDSLALNVPVPQDPRLARLVEAVLADPADNRSLEQWASMLNITSRTLTRAFRTELAMSFARWRRLVRMSAAAGELAGGASVKAVARRVGYGSTSAFVAAFHRTVGRTPGDLVDEF